MATTWELTETCFVDARGAAEVTRDLVAGRELRLDPDTALAGFSLWAGRAARDLRKVELHEERRRLVHPPG